MDTMGIRYPWFLGMFFSAKKWHRLTSLGGLYCFFTTFRAWRASLAFASKPTGPCTALVIVFMHGKQEIRNEFKLLNFIFQTTMIYILITFSVNNEQTNTQTLFEDLLRKLTLETVIMYVNLDYTWSQSLVILWFASISASSGTLIPNNKEETQFKGICFRTPFYRKTKKHRYSDIQHI